MVETVPVPSAPSWFSPSPCFVTSWQRASHLRSSLVAAEVSSSWVCRPDGAVWELRGPEGCLLRLPVQHLDPGTGSDTCSGSLLPMLPEDHVERRPCPLHDSSGKRDSHLRGVVGPRSGSPSEDAASCLPPSQNSPVRV